MHFNGTILEGERVVAFEVEGDYRVSTRRGGTQFWEGSVSVPRETAVHDGARYRLLLDDGREGEIIVGAGPYTGPHANTFVFKGDGPPPLASHD
jgi:hypothetical protein